ncbi:MAG: polysaccharide lyase, partial [Rhodobacteraceae bacterium]|nr:polysaccharide lyase [Paracoccaceae bacterium]
SHGFRSNCTLPGENSVRLHAIGADQKVAFTLKPGDVGGCSSDAKPRHGARYWERAELKQTSTLAVGQTHRISFEATFEQGFRGKAETFFQIHAWSRDCKSAPLLMLQFDQKRLKTHVLQRTSDKFQSGISRGNKGALAEIKASRSARKTLTTDALAGGPHRFDITFDTSGRNARMSVKMDGMPLVKNERVHLQRCVRPHVKFGIYRPGKTNRKTSVLLIDDVVISSR